MRALHAAIDLGVNFIDTADVYGDGHSSDSSRASGASGARRSSWRRKPAGGCRRKSPRATTAQNLTAFVERSLRNLDGDAIDLLQLHCPPSEVYEMPEVFGILDDLVGAGKMRHYGVSVERVDEAIRATDYPNVQSVQIIFNMFRLKPAERFFPLARDETVGVIARVPLASGLLTGKLRATRDSRRPIIATSIGTANRSTPAKRSAASITTTGFAPSKSCAISFRPARRWPSSRCAGS